MLTKGGWGAILIPNKMDSMEKSIARETDGPCIEVKGSIHQEDIVVLNSYAPNIRITKYIKQNPSIKDRSSKQNISKDRDELTTINQQDITAI